MERLQKALARAGVASRRKAEALIASGSVQVNGKTVTQPGTRIDPSADLVLVNGVRVAFDAPRTYLMLNKPAGAVSTRTDPQGRRTVLDLLPQKLRHLHPVGRLDAATEGLLLLTDDGAFTHRLTHPRHEIGKIYRAVVKGLVQDASLREMERGIRLDEALTAPCRARVIRRGAGQSEVELKVHEGRKRQVRRMLQAIGHPVLRLKRTQIGGIRLGALQPGRYRRLTAREVEHLMDNG